MLELLNTFSTLNIFLVISANVFIYTYTKSIKKAHKCLKKKGIEIDHKSTTVIGLKYISLLNITLVIIAYFTPIQYVILKIPIISGFYSLIILGLLIFQTASFMNINNKLNNTGSGNGYQCLEWLPFKYKINNILVNYKYKVSLTYIFLTYVGITYS